MKILSHRGYWLEDREKNSREAFKRSFELGYGTETDIRDLCGELVIAHDPPLSEAITAKEFFEIYCQFDKSLPLALNIKSDGLQPKLLSLLEEFGIENYFLFDMSIPDLLKSHKSGLKIFSRESEYEVLTDALLEKSEGVWFDYFHSFNFQEARVAKLIDQGLKVCLVSPDLHRAEYESYWLSLANSKVIESDYLYICTDYPELANEKILKSS